MNSNAKKQSLYKGRKRESGYRRLEVWVTEAEKLALKKYLNELRGENNDTPIVHR